MIVFDFVPYQDGEKTPDLRSFSRTSQGAPYYGKSVDVAKLPKYRSLPSGTLAYCVDTGDTYMYCATDQTWYAQ